MVVDILRFLRCLNRIGGGARTEPMRLTLGVEREQQAVRLEHKAYVA
jgi:hypothetical protein